MKQSILITGASGYVGQATFQAATAAGYTVAGTYFRHCPHLPGGTWYPLDLRDDTAVSGLLVRLRPVAVIHAAAAWTTAEEAVATIVEGTRAVAEATAELDARLIHLSSDVVFDGEHAPYTESDAPAPMSFYAEAKARAEEVIKNTLTDYVIVRTSLVTCFEPPDPRTEVVLDTLAAGAANPVTLFTDEYRCPVRTEDLAAALVELIDHPYRGVLHVAGPERLSRHALGLRIAAYHNLPPGGIQAGTVAASGLVRPRDCTVDISLARRILSTQLRPLPFRPSR